MSAVDVRTRLLGDTAVIYPGPYLNQLRGEGLETRAGEILAQGVNRIVINFARTELVNSIGISNLLAVIQAVNEARGIVMISNLSKTNRELFEVLGLLSHVTVEETEESALARIGVPADDRRNESGGGPETN